MSKLYIYRHLEEMEKLGITFNDEVYADSAETKSPWKNNTEYDPQKNIQSRLVLTTV